MSWGARDLTVRFGRRIALDGVELDVDRGELVAVVGGDGAGKTTLLRALVGTVRAVAGSVRRPPRDRIGYLSAGPGVYRDLTVEENVRFAAAGYGVSRARTDQRLEELLDRMGLSSARDRMGAHLSGGMRQKLALAVAMVHEPELLVLDEPTTGLDPVSRAELWRLVAGAAAGGAGVVFATTYLDEAERASFVLALDGGRTLAAGTPDDVVASVPGWVIETQTRPEAERAAERSWRRGSAFRVWVPPGDPPPTGPAVEAELEDAVIVAALARRERAGAAA